MAETERVEYWVQYKSKRGKVWHDYNMKTTARDAINSAGNIAKSLSKYDDFRAVKRIIVTTITEEVL